MSSRITSEEFAEIYLHLEAPTMAAYETYKTYERLCATPDGGMHQFRQTLLKLQRVPEPTRYIEYILAFLQTLFGVLSPPSEVFQLLREIENTLPKDSPLFKGCYYRTFIKHDKQTIFLIHSKGNSNIKRLYTVYPQRHRVKSVMQEALDSENLTWADALQEIPVLGTILLYIVIGATVDNIIATPQNNPAILPELKTALEEMFTLTKNVSQDLKPCLPRNFTFSDLFKTVEYSDEFQKTIIAAFSCPGSLKDVDPIARKNGIFKNWSEAAQEEYKKLLTQTYNTMSTNARAEVIAHIPELPKETLLKSGIRWETILKKTNASLFYSRWGSLAPFAEEFALQNKQLKVKELVPLLDTLLLN